MILILLYASNKHKVNQFRIQDGFVLFLHFLSFVVSLSFVSYVQSALLKGLTQL